jgi:hypothetical protein
VKTGNNLGQQYYSIKAPGYDGFDYFKWVGNPPPKNNSRDPPAPSNQFHGVITTGSKAPPPTPRAFSVPLPNFRAKSAPQNELADEVSRVNMNFLSFAKKQKDEMAELRTYLNERMDYITVLEARTAGDDARMAALEQRIKSSEQKIAQLLGLVNDAVKRSEDQFNPELAQREELDSLFAAVDRHEKKARAKAQAMVNASLEETVSLDQGSGGNWKEKFASPLEPISEKKAASFSAWHAANKPAPEPPAVKPKKRATATRTQPKRKASEKKSAPSKRKATEESEEVMIVDDEPGQPAPTISDDELERAFRNQQHPRDKKSKK